MSLFSKLFGKKKTRPKTSGELIAETTGGANLVDGKQTWEYAKKGKHDLLTMKKCCDAELKTMNKTGLVPAPYYFERVAILSRKEKNYRQEIKYCELYIDTVEKFYQKNDATQMADVRKGPTYQSIVKRLQKAMDLMKKQNQSGNLD